MRMDREKMVKGKRKSLLAFDPPELSIVWGGDFNCVSDSAFDRLHPNNHSSFIELRPRGNGAG